MHVALIKVGEPLPGLQAERQQRMGLLADELIERGHRVTWLTNTADRRDGSVLSPKRLRYTTKNGIDVIAVTSLGYGTKVGLRRLGDAYLTALKIAYEFCRLRDVDLCVISLPLLEVAAVVAPISRIRRVTTVVDVRDLYPDNYLDAIRDRLGRFLPLASWPLNGLAQVALRTPHARYAISEDYLRWAAALAGPGAASDQAIPLPFPGGLETPPDKAERRAGVTSAVFLGAFNRIIDLHTVIDAARMLEKTHPGEFEFVLAGDGEFRTDLEAHAEGCPSVQFPGWVEPTAVRHLLAEADIGLAPYRSAGASAMGNKYMEYLWASLPVLTADSQVADLLGQNKAGAGYQSAEDLAEKLVRFAARDLAISGVDASAFFTGPLNRGQSQQKMASDLENLAHAKHR